jgi:hypothetical protein
MSYITIFPEKAQTVLKAAEDTVFSSGEGSKPVLNLLKLMLPLWSRL